MQRNNCVAHLLINNNLIDFTSYRSEDKLSINLKSTIDRTFQVEQGLKINYGNLNFLLIP